MKETFVLTFSNGTKHMMKKDQFEKDIIPCIISEPKLQTTSFKFDALYIGKLVIVPYNRKIYKAVIINILDKDTIVVSTEKKPLETWEVYETEIIYERIVIL